MRKQFATTAKTYSKAKTVAILWVLSAMLPVFMIPHNKWHFEAINFGAIALFAVIAFILFRFIQRRLTEKSWAFSDSLVYIFVPLILFVGYFCLMLSPVVR